MGLVLRQSSEVLRRDANVDLASDWKNGSIRYIRIESLITPSPVMKDKVLNSLTDKVFC